MARKRADGEGTVRKQKDGRWRGQISLGSDINGKRQRKDVYGKTQGEVVAKLEQLRQQRSKGVQSLVNRDSVEGFIQRWLDDHIALNRSPKTLQEYSGVIRLYINPQIGSKRLNQLDGETLVKWQAGLSRKGISADIRFRTVKILRIALNYAVKMRLLPFNPAMAIDRPKVSRKEMRTLEPEECFRLFEACEKHRLGDAIILAVLTGLRKGEVLGLQWSSVNIRERILVVRNTLEEVSGKRRLKDPKTTAGRRMIPLEDQAIEALNQRLRKANEEGFSPAEVANVFPNERGGFVHGSNFDRRVWHPIRKAAKLPEEFRFHELRHTHVSLMVAAGISLKTIQTRVGHKDFTLTANTYAHLMKNTQVEAVEQFGQFMMNAKPKKAGGGQDWRSDSPEEPAEVTETDQNTEENKCARVDSNH